MSVTEATVVVDRVGFGPDAVAYQDGWDLQRTTHERVLVGGPPTLQKVEQGCPSGPQQLEFRFMEKLAQRPGKAHNGAFSGCI